MNAVYLSHWFTLVILVSSSLLLSCSSCSTSIQLRTTQMIQTAAWLLTLQSSFSFAVRSRVAPKSEKNAIVLLGSDRVVSIVKQWGFQRSSAWCFVAIGGCSYSLISMVFIVHLKLPSYSWVLCTPLELTPDRGACFHSLQLINLEWLFNTGQLSKSIVDVPQLEHQP